MIDFDPGDFAPPETDEDHDLFYDVPDELRTASALHMTQATSPSVRARSSSKMRSALCSEVETAEARSWKVPGTALCLDNMFMAA